MKRWKGTGVRAWIAAAACLAAIPAGASCTWEWLCNGEGRCKQMPICDSVYETPPPRPEGAEPPAVPPLRLRPRRIAGASINTTLTCEHIMRKSRSGRWTWHEACFCTDPERSKDSTPPFANIVRCDANP